MIRADMIPDEVVEAAATTLATTLMGRMMVSQQDALHVWSNMYEPEKEQFRREARAAIAAALNAWPFGAVCHYTIKNTEGWELILPLPQEGA